MKNLFAFEKGKITRIVKLVVFSMIFFSAITFIFVQCDSDESKLTQINEDSEIIKKGYSKIDVNFITPEGKPYEVKRFVISDGKFYKEFENITSINELVPNKCSYRFVWHSGEYDTQDQITLNLQNRKYDFNFYCLDRNKTKSKVEPYILIEEKGANAKLSSKWDENLQELSFSLDREPGKIVDVVTWIDTKLLELPNYGLVSLKSPIDTQLGGDASVCFPPNINFTISWDWLAPQEKNSEGNTVKLKFEKVPDDYTFVGIREANDNGSIISDPSNGIKTKDIELRTINNELISSKYIYPQFAVKEGLYFITPKYISKSNYYSPTLPIKVEKSKASIFEYYPIKTEKLIPNSFHLVAEYYHTLTNVKATFKNNEILIQGNAKQNFATEHSNYYYASIILDSLTRITNINSYSNSNEKSLRMDSTNYTLKKINNLQVLTLRIPYSFDNITISTSK